jgi:hypothetical protein
MRAAEQIQLAPLRHLFYRWMIESRSQYDPAVSTRSVVLGVRERQRTHKSLRVSTTMPKFHPIRRL